MEEKRLREERHQKALEQQEKRLKRKAELAAAEQENKRKLKVIKEIQGNKYQHNILEREFKENVQDYEEARQQKLIAERKDKLKKQYAEISKQRQVYAKVMKKATQQRESAVSLYDQSRDAPYLYEMNSPKSSGKPVVNNFNTRASSVRPQVYQSIESSNVFSTDQDERIRP